MSGTRIISNIEALKEITKAETLDLVIIGKRSTSNTDGKKYDPKSITIEKFMELVNSGTNILLDEDDFASDSNSKAPTQQSTKAYIASQLASGGFTLLDDDTMSAASRTQAATQGSIKVYIDNSVTFTNPVGETTVRNTFGDIKSGVTNINGLTYQEIFENMFFPYSLPSFSSFTLNGISTVQEIGASIGQNQTFTWGYNNSGNISTASNAIALSNYIGTYLPATFGVPKTTTSQAVSFNSVITSSTPGDTVGFTVTGLNTKNTTFSRNYVMGFYGRVIWGTHASPVINTGQAAALTASQNDLTKNMTNSTGNDIVGSRLTFNPSGSEYSYLLIPTGVQMPNDIRNSTLSSIANSFDMYQNLSGQTDIVINTATGINVTYKVFRSQNASSGASTCIISN